MTGPLQRVSSSDHLLLEYASAVTRLACAPAQRLTLHPGRTSTLFCTAVRGCNGTPKLEQDNDGLPQYKCSACRKVWSTETIELGANSIGRTKPRRGKTSDVTYLRAQLIDFGRVLDDVERGNPLAFACWVLLVLGPGQVYRREHEGEVIAEGSVPMLGMPREAIPDMLQTLATQGSVPEQWRHTSIWTVRQGIRWAREETMRQVQRRVESDFGFACASF